METLFASARCALDKIDELNNSLNNENGYSSLSIEDRAILSNPMMYLAMVINESDPFWGRDLCHALHAIYYREEGNQLWQK